MLSSYVGCPIDSDPWILAMKPENAWKDDWRCGLDPELELKVAKELVEIFQEFWKWSSLEARNRSTKQRYAAGLHALGGFLVEEAGNGRRGNRSTREFIMSYIDCGEGPLIHPDNEAWQKELDTVCRKLYKYLVSASANKAAPGDARLSDNG